MNKLLVDAVSLHYDMLFGAQVSLRQMTHAVPLAIRG